MRDKEAERERGGSPERHMPAVREINAVKERPRRRVSERKRERERERERDREREREVKKKTPAKPPKRKKEYPQ